MHHPEYHKAHAGVKLNWLRASVLGANDGIVSIAGLVFGVAGATAESGVIFATGVAGIAAGALSMAVGEYVSVSSSRDSERALFEKEKYELTHFPEHELDELITLYEKKGLSRTTAEQVAHELTAKDAFKAHAEAELKLDPDHPSNPWQAALASGTAFLLGAIIPLLAITLPPAEVRIPGAAIAVLFSLMLTGYVSAWAGGADKARAVIRVVLGGAIAMAVTYGIGSLIGSAAL